MLVCVCVRACAYVCMCVCVSTQDERLDELVPRVVIDKFAKAYVDGLLHLLQVDILPSTIQF